MSESPSACDWLVMWIHYCIISLQLDYNKKDSRGNCSNPGNISTCQQFAQHKTSLAIWMMNSGELEITFGRDKRSVHDICYSQVYKKIINGSPAIQKKNNRTSTITNIIIHQIFSLARDLSKRVTWTNIPQQNWGISEITKNWIIV